MPKRDSAEAACEDVIEGCKLGPEDEKYLQAMQDEWRAQTDGKDLSQRIDLYVALHVVTAFGRKIEQRVGGRFAPATYKRNLNRLCRIIERDFIHELVAEPRPNAVIFLGRVEARLTYFLERAALLAWHRAVERALLERLRETAFKTFKKSGFSGAARDAAIGRSRQLMNDHLALYIEHVNAGIDDWHPPAEAFDTLLTALSGGSAVTGAAGSLLTALFLFDAAPVLFGIGIALTAVGGVAGAVAAVRSQLAAEEASAQRQVEDRVRDALRTIGRARVDSLTPVLDFLATLLTEAAFKEGIDVTGSTSTPLYAFAWERLFPKVPQQRVAAAAYFKQAFDEMLKRAAAP